MWVGTVISQFPIISQVLEIVVAAAMFVTQVIVLEDDTVCTMGDYAGSQADGVDVLYEVLGAAYKFRNYLNGEIS